MQHLHFQNASFPDLREKKTDKYTSLTIKNEHMQIANNGFTHIADKIRKSQTVSYIA